jgi:hypothetical protein
VSDVAHGPLVFNPLLVVPVLVQLATTTANLNKFGILNQQQAMCRQMISSRRMEIINDKLTLSLNKICNTGGICSL